MRHFFTALLLSFIATFAYGTQQSDFYDPELLLDSIVTPKEIKTVYAFDQWGNRTLDEMYSWSESEKVWIGVYKMKLTFDQQGNNTLYESYSWDEINNTWMGSLKSEYTYRNDFMIRAIMYKSDPTTYTWIPWMKNNFEYDEAGNQTYYEYNRWSEEKNDWVPDSKFIYVYDDLSQIILAEEWIWDSKQEIWDGYIKIEHEYSGVLNIMLTKQYAWNSTDLSWFLTNETEGQWNESHSCWTLTEYEVLGDSKEPIRSLLYYFNPTSGQSSPSIYDEYINPFDQPAPSLNDDKHMNIFDISGRRIAVEQMSGLPKGIYIVNDKKVIKR